MNTSTIITNKSASLLALQYCSSENKRIHVFGIKMVAQPVYNQPSCENSLLGSCGVAELLLTVLTSPGKVFIEFIEKIFHKGCSLVAACCFCVIFVCQ